MKTLFSTFLLATALGLSFLASADQTLDKALDRASDKAYDEAYFNNQRVYTSPLIYLKKTGLSCDQILNKKAYQDIQDSHMGILPGSIFKDMKRISLEVQIDGKTYCIAGAIY